MSLVWSRLGVEPAGLLEIAENCEVFRSLSRVAGPVPLP